MNILNIIISIINALLGNKPKIADVIPQIEPVQSREQIVDKVLKLKRLEYRPDGIFSSLSLNEHIIAYTLDHSYDNKPKLYDGIFKCVRGPHRLHNMTEDFETFEITGVEGHTGVLFHWGNYNSDSDGCLLLGKDIAEVNGIKMVTSSKDTFANFMSTMNGVNEFQLVVD